jgi:hypothetical protein
VQLGLCSKFFGLCYELRRERGGGGYYYSYKLRRGLVREMFRFDVLSEKKSVALRLFHNFHSNSFTLSHCYMSHLNLEGCTKKGCYCEIMT